MKRLLKKIGGFIFLLVLSCSNLSVCATEGIVSEISVYHEHSGNASGGGCYSKPNYHSHIGNAVNGGSCYNPVYHMHKGNNSSGGACFQTPVYHSHTGNSASGGGCYTKAKTVTQTFTCTDTTAHMSTDHIDSTCPNCGPVYARRFNYYYTCPNDYDSWNQNWVGFKNQCQSCDNIYGVSGIADTGVTRTHTASKNVIVYELGCNKTTATIEKYNQSCTKTTATIDSYVLGCTKTATSIDSYSLGCNKTPETEVGKLQLSKKYGVEYRLSVNSVNVDIKSCLWSTGDSSQSVLVTANQEYSCKVTYSVEGRTETADLSYNVTDYDTAGPVVTINYDDSSWEKSKNISIDATDAGVGLHNTAYRYNNGTGWSSWSDSSSYTIKANGTYGVAVRDAIGNITEKSFIITHIDTVAPEVSVTCDKANNIHVTAKDTGVGLHVTAYRYHNGVTWSEWSKNSSYKVENSGNYRIEVRDSLLNITQKEIVITKVQSTDTNTLKETQNEKTPIVDVIPSQEKAPIVKVPPLKEKAQKEEGTVTTSKKDVTSVKDKKDEVTVKSGEIEVEEAMSEPKKEEFIYQTIIAKEDESIEKNYVPIPYEEDEFRTSSDSTYGQMACAVGVIGVPFLFFGCMGNTKIYSVNEQGKRKFLCRAFLNKKGKLKISRFYLKKNKSNTILIKPSKAILEKKCGKNMSIRIGECNFSKQIQEEILLEY